MIPTLTVKQYACISILILIALLGATTYYYHAKYQDSKVLIDKLREKNIALTALVEADAKAVEELASESKKREEEAAAALAAAVKRNKQYEIYAQDLLSRIPPDANLCTSANMLFNEYLGKK